MPLFDGGARRANVVAARAAYDEATAAYAATLRDAVREIEVALLALQATADRQGDSELAAAGYAASLKGAEQRYQGGLGSLLELEEVRRSALQADVAVVELRRERVTTWIALFKALGGAVESEAAGSAAAAAAPAATVAQGRQP